MKMSVFAEASELRLNFDSITYPVGNRFLLDRRYSKKEIEGGNALQTAL